MPRLWTKLKRIAGWVCAAWPVVFFVVCLGKAVASVVQGNLFLGLAELGATVCFLVLLAWGAHRITLCEVPPTRDVPGDRAAFHTMEVRYEAGQGWSLHDLLTGDRLPLEVGDLFCVVLPSTFPKEED